MAWCRQAPSHYLNLCWQIVSWILGNKLEWIKIQQIQFEKIHLKMSSANRQPFCGGINDDLMFLFQTKERGGSCSLGAKWVHRVLHATESHPRIPQKTSQWGMLAHWCCWLLTLKQRETYGPSVHSDHCGYCCLVLKHQGISIHMSEKISVVLEQLHFEKNKNKKTV